MKQKKRSIRWNTMGILVGGFLAVILAGAVLLWLPASNQKPITFLDALFTATTSVCVTGLVTVTPATQFTLFGKVVLLILIQIGGLGVIACATAFFIILKRKITIKERVLIQETYNMDSIGGMVGLVKRILTGTLLVEAAGALLYAVQFIPEYGPVKGAGYALFHSISAFCNAGIDILGDSSLAKYALNPLVNITTMLLIVLGGLGFTVWYDVIENGKRIHRHEVPKRWWFTRLKLHSKLAIVTTAVLLGIGTLLTLVLEYQNPETIGQMSFGGKLMTSLFQSVTTRTAGFFTIPQASMHEETRFVCMILMFIGGSPGGTAGGVKTTTVTMLVLTCITLVRGGHDTECFGRRISRSNFRMGITIIMLAFTIFLTGTTLVAIFEPDSTPFLNIMYETASAIGTVGLTADVTAGLSVASRFVIMIMMFAGRLGPMTLALLFAGKPNPRDRIRELPSERIMVG